MAKAIAAEALQARTVDLPPPPVSTYERLGAHSVRAIKRGSWSGSGCTTVPPVAKALPASAPHLLSLLPVASTCTPP